MNIFLKPILNLANEARKKLRMSKKNQSILITGSSGSGKTENGKHIIDFLSQESRNSSQNLSDAKTKSNMNSSRFCKHVEVIFTLEI